VAYGLSWLCLGIILAIGGGLWLDHGNDGDQGGLIITVQFVLPALAALGLLAGAIARLGRVRHAQWLILVHSFFVAASLFIWINNRA